jgi:hypothetical protein
MTSATSAVLFWMITLFGGALAGWALTMPFAGISAETRAAEAELTTAVDRLRLLASQLTKLRQQPLPDLARYATAGVDVTTEATNLQERARQTFANVEGSVLGSQANQQELPEGDVKISILIQAQLSEAQLMTALDGLETGAAPFVIETMTLDLLPGVADGRNLNAVLMLSRLVTHAP